jgi:hypothetical protein
MVMLLCFQSLSRAAFPMVAEIRFASTKHDVQLPVFMLWFVAAG